MIEAEKKKILDYIAAGATDAAIMEALHIPQRMYHRRMSSIRKDHLRDVLDSQTEEARASILVQCMDKMKWLEMQAQRIVMDHNAKEFDRLQAMDRVRQFKLDQAKLLTEGPTIFRVIPKDGLHLGDKRTAIELRDAPVLSEPIETTTTTTANDERQF